MKNNYSSVYFLNDKQKLIRVVKEKYLTQNLQEKEITADKSELVNNTLSVGTIYDQGLQDTRYMAVRENDLSFSVYEIVNDSDPQKTNFYVGVDFAVKELEGYIVKDIRPKDKPIAIVASQILQATDAEWRLGYTKPNLPIISDTFYYLSVKDCLKQLQSHGCEILFKCRIDNTGIVDKWIEIYDQIGTASKKRFVYGHSALDIVKEIDRSQIYTSLIGRGKGEEVGDGYGRRLEFTDIEWKKSAGKPLDKPKGQNWLEFPEMTTEHGIPTKAGNKRKREGVTVFEDIEDAEELLLNTYNVLMESSRPLVHFKTEVFGGDDIGNTIPVIRHDRNYKYKARIFKVSVNRITGNVQAEVGDNLAKKSSTRVSSDIQVNLERVETEKASFYTAEQIAQWQSDIIRGLKGGSYILLTEADLGISEERIPYCSVWMNGKSLETSDHFLVANSEGIGFIEGDFNLDNFHTAWTIDGVFNARYIQVGRLGGEQVYMDLDSGEVFFAKGFIKSANGNLKINITEGIIEGPIIKSYTYGNFAGIVIQNGNVHVVDSGGNDIGKLGTSTLSGREMIVANRQGKSLVIGTENGNTLGALIQIPSESTVENPKMFYHNQHNFSRAQVTFSSDNFQLGLGKICLPTRISSDGVVQSYYEVNW